MYELTVNFDKCKGCMVCETLLPRFRNVYGGRLLISSTNAQDEEIMAAARRVQNGCPEDAIEFKRVSE